MAIKVIAQRRELKIGKNPGVKKFVMRPDTSTSLSRRRKCSQRPLPILVVEVPRAAGMTAAVSLTREVRKSRKRGDSRITRDCPHDRINRPAHGHP